MSSLDLYATVVQHQTESGLITEHHPVPLKGPISPWSTSLQKIQNMLKSWEACNINFIIKPFISNRFCTNEFIT